MTIVARHRLVAAKRPCSPGFLRHSKSSSNIYNHDVPIKATTKEAKQDSAIVTEHTKRHPLLRFLNPWLDVAQMTPEYELGAKVITYSQTWGISAVLVCGLSAAALVSVPHTETASEPPSRESAMDDPVKKRVNKSSSPSSVLESAGVLSTNRLHDAYIVAAITSFFTGGSALGLATVVNVLATATPTVAMRSFVIQQSLSLSLIPFLTATSGGLIGLALAIGIDMTHQGGLVPLVAYGDFVMTSVLVGGASIFGQIGLYRTLLACSKAPSPK